MPGLGPVAGGVGFYKKRMYLAELGLRKVSCRVGPASRADPVTNRQPLNQPLLHGVASQLGVRLRADFLENASPVGRDGFWAEK